MFSNNGKISNHQAIRLLILDVFTGACLFLPMALSRMAKRWIFGVNSRAFVDFS